MPRLIAPLLIATLVAILLGTAMLARASDARANDDTPPPASSLSLSQAVLQIEALPDFGYIKEVEWDGRDYEIEYRTRDGETRELKVDPRTARPRPKP